MDGHCQRWAAIGYWAGVIVFALYPNWTGILVGWGICQLTAAIAG